MKEREFVTLVVDDEVDMCWALERILQGEGFETHSAYNAEDALNMLNKKAPQLVFLDVKLPDMDGIELARLIKTSNPAMPVILISGYYYNDDPTIQKGLEEGLSIGFISKPFKINEIRHYIHRLFPKKSLSK
ncbi:MAG TPA: response regulator [Candidatus Hypogeohydataceae bacterium YC41]